MRILKYFSVLSAFILFSASQVLAADDQVERCFSKVVFKNAESYSKFIQAKSEHLPSVKEERVENEGYGDFQGNTVALLSATAHDDSASRIEISVRKLEDLAETAGEMKNLRRVEFLGCTTLKLEK